MPPAITEIERILAEAIEMASTADRQAFVERACAGDDALQRQVEDLIANYFRAGAFLERPAHYDLPTNIVGGCAEDDTVCEAPGTMIGPYKLREQIGEGGMGVVYVAEQERPVRRKVALKLIKPGMDTREVIARFEAERQALALMDHPHIAKVLDAGTTGDFPPLRKGGSGGVALPGDHGLSAQPLDANVNRPTSQAGKPDLQCGRPYFVMELVRGLPITEYCDKCHLGPRERLKLFVQVCQAVQHAHQKGVIHRDLKPSNVLVTLHDGVPVPKVIDFGVAKAINQRLSEHTVYTRMSQMVGTPMYMSPEQAELSGLDVDTRSDVYSLGVLLYELLVGATPFDKETFSKAGFDEVRRIIREDEPLRPSQRVSTLEPKSRLTVSGRRGIDERKLTRVLRGELDWLVMKALEKDRQRRYESASAFAADVQRYLDDQPVEACPPSASYRLRKYARRNRATLTTLIVVSTALVVGTALSLWQAFEATNARKLADDRLVQADKALKNETNARTEADTQRKQASQNLQQALDAVDQMLMRVADDRLAAIPGAEPVRRELFQDALKFYDAFFEQAPDDPQLRMSTAKAWARVGNLHQFLGNLAAAQQAIQSWESLQAEDPEDPQIEAALAILYREFGDGEHWARGKRDSGELAYNRSIALWHNLQHRFPDQLDYQWEATRVETSLGSIYSVTDRLEMVRRCLQNVVDTQRRLWNRQAISGTNQAYAGYPLIFLAGLTQHDDEEVERLLVEAVRICEDVVAVDPQAFQPLSSLVCAQFEYGHFLERLGRIAEAETYYRHSVETGQALPLINPSAFGDFYFIPRTQFALAGLLDRNGRTFEALMVYRAARDLMCPGTAGPNPHPTSQSACRTAESGIVSSLQTLAHGGQRDDAINFCEELSRTRGSAVEQFQCRILAARAWHAIGDVDRAVQVIREVSLQLESKIGVTQWQGARVAGVQELLTASGDLYMEIRRDAVLAARISDALDQPLDYASGDIGAYRERGALHAALGQFSRARRDFESAVTTGDAGGQAGSHERYLRALCYLHDYDKAMYRAAANEILARFTASQDAEALHWTVWTCVLAAGGLDEYRPLVELARRGYNRQPTNLSMKLALGAALFRAGEFEQALQSLNECEATSTNPNNTPLYARYFLAMTHHKLGHEAEARQWLDRAESETTRMLAGGKTEGGEPLMWNRRLTLELLRAEARELLGEPPGNLRHQDDPEVM